MALASVISVQTPQSAAILHNASGVVMNDNKAFVEKVAPVMAAAPPNAAAMPRNRPG